MNKQFDNYIYALAIDSVHNSEVLMARITGKKSHSTFHQAAPYTPPVYTDLRSWMLLNYTLFALMLSIPLLVILKLLGWVS